MASRIILAMFIALGIGGSAVCKAAEDKAAEVGAPVPPAVGPIISGVYPHLAVTNGSAAESGIGAVAAWADRLWYVTYPAHFPFGSNDKLYELDSALHATPRKESVGGTHAGRMIHRESKQLIIGPYFIDAQGRVRDVSPRAMPGRITAVARHLKDPAHKVYFATMEQGFYEVDVDSLAVTVLHKDANAGGEMFLPGNHGKACYAGQGRLVFVNNGEGGTDDFARAPRVANTGEGGVLAEWDGSKELAAPDAWKIIDRNKYVEVTGPGGLWGAPDDQSPLWALGWDSRSVLLAVRDRGAWTRFRLPKASYTQDASHGWYTEWPRIREAGGHLLMNMHDMFYDFPRTFRPGCSAGLRPISTFLKMVVDYSDWNGRLVLANNDASRQGNPILLCPQSNLWFGRWDDLKGFGKPAGWGGPWVNDDVKANVPSEPFLLAGFEHRVVHLAHATAVPVVFTLEIDKAGDGNWAKYASVTVPANGYVWHVIPPDVAGEWIRLKADRDAKGVTAYFHYSSGHAAADPSLFGSLPSADRGVRQSEGILQPGEGAGLPLNFAATVADDSGKVVAAGYYVLGEDLRLRRTDDAAAEKSLRQRWAPRQSFEVDAASVIVRDRKGNPYRLPKGPDVFSRPAASGYRRGIREVVTERYLMNVHGTFYELPREESGGLAKIRPIATHNRRIFDFASWRGLLVLSGNLAGAAADGHYIASDDGKVGLWLGNVEDLWRLGVPRGEGGPWCDTPVAANAPSDPYLMTGYDRKTVRLSHDRPQPVRFTIEVDFLATGQWQPYQTFTVAAGQTLAYEFPSGFSAHWVRVRADTDCKATAWFRYDVPMGERSAKSAQYLSRNSPP